MRPRTRLPRSLLRSVAVLLAATLPAQGEAPGAPKRVEGTVRDERGAPIAGASVRLVVCTHPYKPGLVAVELANDPLPTSRSSAQGTWSLVLTPVHQRFSSELQGGLALVVEADGRQPWRELLPSPAGLYAGSDVVLRARTADDDARIVVPEVPPGAIVRLQRRGDRNHIAIGGRPPGETYDLPVPAGGRLTVNVPLLPSPLVLASGDRGAPLGWTVQLLAPGRSSLPKAIAAGETLELSPAQASTAVPAVTSADTPLVVEQLLAVLPDGTVRWFPSPGKNVPDDPQLPIVALQCTAGGGPSRLVDWPGPIPPLPAAAPNRLQFRAPDGTIVRGVQVHWCAADTLQHWTNDGLRPLRVTHRQLATDGALACDATTSRPCAWIHAPGHVPRFVLDVRTLPAAEGTASIELTPLPHELTVKVRDEQNRPLAGACVVAYHTTLHGQRVSCHGPWLTADGGLPRTDGDGTCRMPHDSGWPMVDVQKPGYECGQHEFDETTRTFVVTARPLAAWPLRTLDGAGKPQPFANVGCQVLLQQDASGSQWTTRAVCTDSRGEAVLLAAADEKPQAAAMQLGGFPERGTPLRQGEVTTVAVADEPLVIVHLPGSPSGSVRSVFAWRRAGSGRPLGNEAAAESSAGPWWFRWPRDLRLWVQDAPHAPPVVLSMAQDAAGPLAFDGTRPTRSMPLHLHGDVPKDLTQLRVVPKAIDGLAVDGGMALGGEYLANDRTALRLQTMDLLDHTVTLLHPELLPQPLTLAAGPATGGGLTATVAPGAPCTLVVQMGTPLDHRQRVFLTARLGRRALATVELFEPRLHTDAVRSGIELRTPFALPAGTVELRLSPGGTTKVTVDGTQPVRAEITAR